MILTTERLTLRPWSLTDAESLFLYAKDERVGPIAGWPPHKSVEESREVIRTIFMQDGVFAITLKGEKEIIGCIGLIIGGKSNFPIGDTEGEISYWLGVPFWGNGIMPEAVDRIVRYGFDDLHLETLWCGYFDGNERSGRVAEKCGFRRHSTDTDRYYPLTDDIRTEHISCLTIHEWRDKDSFSFSTLRLTAHPLTDADIPVLHSFMGRKEVMYAWEHGFSEEEVREWIAKQTERYVADRMGYLGVWLKESNILIGEAGLLKSRIDGKDAVEIAYILDSRYWHNGYATEIAERLLEHAFGRLGLNEVYCSIRPTNKASIGVAERLGMKLCGEHIVRYRNQDMPHLIYRIRNGEAMVF